MEHCHKLHQNVLALILDPELLQHSMQFYCSLSEWLTLQITSGHGYLATLITVWAESGFIVAKSMGSLWGRILKAVGVA